MTVSDIIEIVDKIPTSLSIFGVNGPSTLGVKGMHLEIIHSTQISPVVSSKLPGKMGLLGGHGA